MVKYLESSSKGAQKVTGAMEFCVKAMQQALNRLGELPNQLLVNIAAAFLVVGCPGSVRI